MSIKLLHVLHIQALAPIPLDLDRISDGFGYQKCNASLKRVIYVLEFWLHLQIQEISKRIQGLLDLISN